VSITTLISQRQRLMQRLMRGNFLKELRLEHSKHCRCLVSLDDLSLLLRVNTVHSKDSGEKAPSYH
jgi:hypothetical protein